MWRTTDSTDVQSSTNCIWKKEIRSTVPMRLIRGYVTVNVIVDGMKDHRQNKRRQTRKKKYKKQIIKYGNKIEYTKIQNQEIVSKKEFKI